MPVPNTFANATATIPLSQLDANFATTITLGNTAIQLGNTVSTLNNMTLANVTVTSGNVTITNVTVTTANVTTANIATAEIANVTVSGTGTFAAGSNTAPSITTSGDTNTGIYFPAADTIAFTEGGVEAMRIDSSGQVGIGTQSPGATLDVSVALPSMQINATTGTNRVWLRTGNTGGDFYFGRENSAGNSFGVTAYSSVLWSQGAYPMVFATNSTERARITSGGYFKASNNATYTSSTGAYHEAYQSANDYSWIVNNGNASFAYSNILNRANRSASSAYQFFVGESANGGDVEFNLRGDGNGYADGTWNNNGADYAEFFESTTGAALTLGATVVLDGNKVREATDQDPMSAIMGVVRPKEPSKASMIVGNTAWNKWANKYLTDDFDRYIMEDHDVLEWTDEEGKLQTYESHNIPAGVTVPDDAVVKTHDDKGNKFQHYKLNPAWNPDAEYINRENRPEWIIVGLVGQVKILKGQPVNDRWIKMRDVSETVEEWMIR